MNLYKIQHHLKAEPQYIMCDTLVEAIKIWKKKLQTEKDPEVVEWIADYIYLK